MKRVFADTNIILDYLLFRLPGGPVAEQLFQHAIEGELEIYIAAHTVNNIFYILRKQYTENERREILKNVCAICSVVTIDEDMVQKALNDERTGDLEDALQLLCAEKCSAEMFVTRDTELKEISDMLK